MVLLLASASGSAAYAQDFGKDFEESFALSAPEEYPEANSLIIFDRSKIQVSTANITIHRHIRMKVLTKPGVDEVAEQSIYFHKKYDKVKNFKAHTVTPGGKKHKVDKKAIFKKEVGSRREQVFTFPIVDTGCVLEFRYQIVSERFRYLKPWYFQNNIYTLSSEVSVSLASGFTYDISYNNVPRRNQNPEVSEEANPENFAKTNKVFTWRMSDLPPITDEPYMTAEDDYRSSLKFQLLNYQDPYNYIEFVDTWEKLGDEFQHFLDDYCNKRKDLKKLTKALVKDITHPRDQSLAIYQYVSNEIQTSDDYHGSYFVNEKMSELLENRYGSGEEKNLILVEMHKAIGLEAWPTLISLRSNARFNPRTPDLRDFNYMVAFVQFGEEWEFLDTSDKLSPYGLLPPNCLTDGGLLVDGKTSSLVRVNILPLQSTRTDFTRMSIDTTGQVVCESECTFTGYYSSLYSDYYSGKTTEDFVTDHFAERIGVDYSLGEYNCELDSTDRFVVSLQYEAADLVTLLDGNLLIQPPRYAFRTNPFKSKKRFFPVDFMYPKTYRNIVEINLNEAPLRFELPEDVSTSIPGATFKRNCAIENGIAIVTSEIVIDNPTFKRTAYADLRNLFKDIATSSADEIVALYVE